MSELIFNKMKAGRYAHAQAPKTLADCRDIPESYLRTDTSLSKGASEMDVVRHFTQLSQLNFSIDTNPYPLGSCTMKYNPRGVQISTPEFLDFHPETPVSASQGFLACLYDLQEYLKEIVGMQDISLAPMAGAHGEFVGVSMIRAYHLDRGDHERTEILVPDAAHGTNPASAMMCGFQVREIPTKTNGDIDLEALKAAIGPQTAGIMLTNPSTLGTFERDIAEVSKMVHQAGGLLYYDGANLNAILGKVRPGDMGFDVMHLNLHKTFATPHGGGGPGAGPVAVGKRLAPYLPIPRIVKNEGGQYQLFIETDCPKSIGRVTAFMGNALVLIRAFLYTSMLGAEGVPRVAEFATLNANYLLKKLQNIGFTPAYPNRLASHEFCLTLAPELKQFHVRAMDFAKGLLDFGFHAPTVYFPLLVSECLLIEPTETESLETLDQLILVFKKLYEKAKTEPEYLQGAPWTLPVKRLDEVLAARNLDLTYESLD